MSVILHRLARFCKPILFCLNLIICNGFSEIINLLCPSEWKHKHYKPTQGQVSRILKTINKTVTKGQQQSTIFQLLGKLLVSIIFINRVNYDSFCGLHCQTYGNRINGFVNRIEMKFELKGADF